MAINIQNVFNIWPLGTLGSHGWAHSKCVQHLITGHIGDTCCLCSQCVQHVPTGYFGPCPQWDPVLHRLFAIGLFNWTGEDNHLNQTTPAMRHVTMMGVNLFRRIVENNAKVRLFAFCNLCKKANIVLTGGRGDNTQQAN